MTIRLLQSLHEQQQSYPSEFSDEWIRLCLQMDENGLESNNILSLLKDDNRQKRVTGALLMMDKAFLCFYPRKVQEAKFTDVGCKKEIFTIIEQMLKSEDDLSVYSAAWCIAWAGFGEADIIPQEAIAGIAERLVELWISDMSASPNLKRDHFHPFEDTILSIHPKTQKHIYLQSD